MKKALVASTLILLAIVIWSLMALFDSVLLIDRQDDAMKKLQQEKAIAKKALKACWIGRTEKDVDNFVRSVDQSRNFTSRARDLIEVSEMIFFMKDGRVSSIGFHDLETKFGTDELTGTKSDAGSHGLDDAGISK